MLTETLPPAAVQSAATSHRDYWEQKSLKYDCLHPRLRAVAGEVIRLRPETVLDIGCSTGEMGRAIEAGLPRISYFGCDISQTAVDRIGRPQVVQRDLNACGLPFVGQQFDAIVCSGILEYIVDVPACLCEVSSRLVPDGHLVCTYLNIRHFTRLAPRLIGKKVARNISWQKIHPLGEFETLLERAGLTIQKRLLTNGTISANDSAWQAGLVRMSQATVGRIPWMARLAAPQMIYVCQKRS